MAMSTPTKRLGIAIDWPTLRDYMKDYITERNGKPEDEELTRALALSDFLIWLHHKQRQPRTIEETPNGKTTR